MKRILSFILAILIAALLPLIMLLGGVVYPFVMIWEKHNNDNK